MNILVANDDGIDSLGIKKLCEYLSRLGEVYVVAPESERSSASHHLTISGQIRFEDRQMPYARRAIAVWGTPADCTYLGLDLFFKDRIDVVVSGINRGRNVSTDIIYSGTISAAREGHLHALPAMAVSLCSYDSDDYDVAAGYAIRILKKYLADPENTEYFLNVNVPSLKEEEIRGIMICDHTAVLHYDNNLLIKEEDQQKYVVFNEFAVSCDTDLSDMTCDYSAIKAGYVALSALHNDHMAHRQTERLREIYEKSR